MATHKWHLHVTDSARSQIRRLSSKDRKAVFNSIRQLLESENPTFLISVKKLEGTFSGQWRQRQGDYRIFFDILSEPITHLKHTYKGTLHIAEVIHRSQAYRRD